MFQADNATKIALLQALSQHAPIGCAVVDPDLRYLYLNQSLADSIGKPLDRILGATVPEVLPHLWPALQPVYARVLLGEAVRNERLVETALDPADQARTWLVNHFPVTLPDGRRGIGVTVNETTPAMKEMEAIGRLAGGIAHDFNNLLTVINGNCALLLDLAPAGDARHEMLHEIAQAGARAESLTRQLLAFSRRQVLAPRLLDLNEVVQHAEPLLARVLGERSQVRAVLAPGLAPVKADPAQLEHVLLNLATNARDAMPDGGTLTLATRMRMESGGPCVELAVTDTGLGMSSDVLRHAFEPFFTTRGTGRGTGLGLAVVQGVVQQSGGRVMLESAPGAGSTVRIVLPSAGAKGEADAAPVMATSALPRGAETLLLVEDDDGVRKLTARLLRGLGYQVFEAAGPEQALRAVAELVVPIHLLITDVEMPVMNGRALAERLQQQRPDLKVLFISGYSADAVMREGVLHAHLAFLQKPFDETALAYKVREVLAAPAR